MVVLELGLHSSSYRRWLSLFLCPQLEYMLRSLISVDVHNHNLCFCAVHLQLVCIFIWPHTIAMHRHSFLSMTWTIQGLFHLYQRLFQATLQGSYGQSCWLWLTSLEDLEGKGHSHQWSASIIWYSQKNYFSCMFRTVCWLESIFWWRQMQICSRVTLSRVWEMRQRFDIFFRHEFIAEFWTHNSSWQVQ